MKKLFIYPLFLFILPILFAPTVSADLIPPNTHLFDRCVKIVNLNKFPKMNLIAYYTGPMLDGYETYQIENSKCLTKGYKFNNLSIYWNTKNKVNSINPDKLLIKSIQPYGGYINENNPLIREEIEYSLIEPSKDKFILYKSRQVSEYNDGTPAKTQTFNNPLKLDTPLEPKKQIKKIKHKTPTVKQLSPTPVEKPSPKPNKISFWQKIICFFKSLFGANCF